MDVVIESTLKPRVCILGGTGFVGEHLAALLSARGFLVRIPTRRSEQHRGLRVLPGVSVVQADIHDPAALAGVLQGCDAVVNLVAILNERRRGDFHKIHVELVEKLIAACRATGVERVLHMSAINAGDPRARSAYHRSKGEGEDLIHAAAGLKVTSFRPSLIFGPGDHLFNRFASLLKKSIGFFPLACPDARVAPVYVGDVVQAMQLALQRSDTIGQCYELCGPRVYTLRELVEFTAETLELRRCVIGFGDRLSRLQARLLGLLPGTPFSYDNYLALQVDAVCAGGFPPALGIDPTALEEIVPAYLGDDNQRGRFDEYRRQARRSPN